MAPDSTPFERELISGCQQGNTKHQEKLYKLFFGFAMGVALRYTSSRQEAMTIVNDSFLKVFDYINRYQFETTFKGWLRRIVVNTSIDHYRRVSRDLPIIDPEGPESQLAESDGNVIDQLSAEDILNLLNQLPTHYRLVFNLYEIEGYSHEEIAGQLGLSVSTSRVYLVRAKAQLSSLVKYHFYHINERSCR